MTVKLCGLTITGESYLEEVRRFGSTQQIVDLLFSFVHLINILSELLHETPEFCLATLHLSVHCAESITLLSGQHVPHLLIFSCYGLLPVRRRFL